MNLEARLFEFSDCMKRLRLMSPPESLPIVSIVAPLVAFGILNIALVKPRKGTTLETARKFVGSSK